VRANIVRYQDGSTNIDDLLQQEEESEEIKFDIDGVKVSGGALNLTDEMDDRHFSISDLELKTGHVAKNQPIDLQASFTAKGDKPALAAKVEFQGTLLADTVNKQYGVKGLDLALAGDVAMLKGASISLAGDLDAKPELMEFNVADFKLLLKAAMGGKAFEVELDAPGMSARNDQVSSQQATLKLTQTQGDDRLSANLVIADLKGSPKAFQSSGINGEISGKQGARSLAGKLSSPFSGNLETLVFDLPKLVGAVEIKDPALPGGAMKASFAVDAHADIKQEKADVKLDANIDGSRLNGKLAVAGFDKPVVNFDLNADRLDLNKILGQPKATAPSKPQAAKPADLSALKDVLAQGSLNVGAIAYDKYRISNLAMAIKADGKTLTVSPLSLKLDDSQIRGSLGIRNFARPLYVFDLDIDRVDADRYMAQDAAAKPKQDQPKEGKPLDLTALKALNSEGSLRIGSLKVGKVQSSNIRIDLKADGEKLQLDPLSAKVDDSQVRASLGITRFADPVYRFSVDIDRLDADRYISKSEPAAAKSAGDTPIDLSALKNLNASGEARLGWLKLANVKTSNVNIGLKAEGGVAQLSPFSANLYQGSMAGNLRVDARATPSISFKQAMSGIQIGPLLVDAIQNDMLEGKGDLKLEITTQGASVTALKKALNGTAALNLADGAVKGIDIAGTIREVKGKLNVLKGQSSLGADQKKKTDFSEMSATFNIKNGVAHNDDLAMKAPLFRITGSGDIDIGNETLNYVAKPTVVSTLKGQGGSDLSALNGVTIPVRITGTFAAPRYGMDFAAIGAALAKSQLLEKAGGSKGEAVQKLLGGDQAGALEGLLGGKQKSAPAESTAEQPATELAPAPEPKKELTPEEQARKKLNKLLGL
jgi:AsmA protein